MKTNTVMMPRELTSENGAKYLFVSEFFVDHESPCMECADLDSWDDESCIYCNGTNVVIVKIPISWTTIKEIYAKAVHHLGT